MDTAKWQRRGTRLGVWLVAVAIVVAAAGVVYVGTPFHGPDASVAAVEANPSVTVSQQGETYVLEPTGTDASAGLVFYPGGRVHPDAYVGALAALADAGDLRVVIPKMPLNLAVFGQGVASRYVSGTPIDRWYVGGHSLGGVMACRYAEANPDSVAGVVLFGSYCDRDITETTHAVLSITGSADTVLDEQTYTNRLELLPPDATVREIAINHSQFGDYRGQRGDSPSGLSYDTAHERLTDVVQRWLRAQR